MTASLPKTHEYWAPIVLFGALTFVESYVPVTLFPIAYLIKAVIVTAEEIVDEIDAPIELTGLSVTAVVHAPHGAWPTSCYPHYALDGEEILRYIDACAAEKFDEYIR